MATQRVAPLKRLVTGAQGFRRMMNLWPPFLFTGIRVRQISPEFTSVVVQLKKSRLTSNYVGTQFGGSIFAMTDPFWMLLVMRQLGSAYTVWDKSAEVEFIAPATTTLTARFDLDPELLAQLKAQAETGQKVLHWFDTDIVNSDGDVVARVRKQIYIRRKPPRKASTSS